MNSDFLELLALFDQFNVRYLVVGGYAVMRYTEPRYTKDLDLVVSIDSASGVRQALEEFGFPMSNRAEEELRKPNHMISIGRAPSRIDILNHIDGIIFEEAWSERDFAEVGGQNIAFISKDWLIKSKRAAGRPQDLIDLALLEQA